jgi:hypothetical protein
LAEERPLTHHAEIVGMTAVHGALAVVAEHLTGFQVVQLRPLGAVFGLQLLIQCAQMGRWRWCPPEDVAVSASRIVVAGDLLQQCALKDSSVVRPYRRSCSIGSRAQRRSVDPANRSQSTISTSRCRRNRG